MKKWNCDLSKCLRVTLEVNIFDLYLGSNVILSNRQSSLTLWKRDTCLIVAFRTLVIILITASLTSKTWSKISTLKDFTFSTTWFTLNKTKCRISFFFLSLIRFYTWILSLKRLFCTDWSKEKRITSKNQIFHIKSGSIIHTSTCTKEIIQIQCICWWLTCIYLHSEVMTTNVRFPTFHRIPPLSRTTTKFDSSKNRNRQCCAFLPPPPPILILLMITCVMNVRYQTCQVSVTDSGLLYDHSCEVAFET